MGFNYAAEKKKFETLWARLRREYRAAGMSDTAIQKMHDFDWEVFKQERIYRLHTQDLGIGIFDEPSAEQEDKSALMKKFLESVSRWDDYEYLVNKMAAIRWRGSDLDASYHAALFLMASHPALFQKMDRYLCPEGIDFTKMMRKEEFEYDWMKITADAARNLFSWNSKCAATPFEISRMPAPAIRALFTACFIANGDYMVSVRKNDKGEKVFEIDDSAGKRREAFNLQMEQMMEAPGMEPD